MASFTITIPSDASLNLYPDNKANKFKVQLQDPITVTGNERYEVALTDIIIPSNLKHEEQDKDLWIRVQGSLSKSTVTQPDMLPIQNVINIALTASEISGTYFLPGQHFYRDERHLLSTVDKAINDLVSMAKSNGEMGRQDSIRLLKDHENRCKVPLQLEIVTHMAQFTDYNDWKNIKTFNRVHMSRNLLEMLLGRSVTNDQSFAAPNYYHHFYKDYKQKLDSGEIGTEGFILNRDSPQQTYDPDNYDPNLGYGIKKKGKMLIRGYPEHEIWRRPNVGSASQRCTTTYIFPEPENKLVELGHQQMSIFCDFVEPHSVGDTLKPLLRAITRKEKTQLETIHPIKEMSMIVPIYVPVKLKEIRDLEIMINDEHKHLIPFAEGKTVLNLTFRKA